MRRQVMRVMGAEEGAHAELQPHQALRELGFDSLLSVELRNALARVLDIELPATLLYDHPTVAALVAHMGAATASGAASTTTAGQGRAGQKGGRRGRGHLWCPKRQGPRRGAASAWRWWA